MAIIAYDDFENGLIKELWTNSLNTDWQVESGIQGQKIIRSKTAKTQAPLQTYLIPLSGALTYDFDFTTQLVGSTTYGNALLGIGNDTALISTYVVGPQVAIDITYKLSRRGSLYTIYQLNGASWDIVTSGSHEHPTEPTANRINWKAGSDFSIGFGFLKLEDVAKPVSTFSAATVADGASVTSTVSASGVVTAVGAAFPTDDYFDSTSEVARVDVYYTHQDGRQKKRLVHQYPGFAAGASWSSFARDGTWAKSKVRAFDWEGAKIDLDGTNIPSGENLTHADGTMNLNT